MLTSLPIRRAATSTRRISILLATLLSPFAEHDLGCVCILDSLFGTVAKLESSEALALSRWCYVTGWKPGLDWGTWAEFKRSHLLTMRVVKLHHFTGAS